MPQKKDDFEEIFWTVVFTFGGIWLLNKILSQPKKQPGIFGLPYERELKAYVDSNGKRIFDEDLKKFDPKEIGFIIGEIIIPARTREVLSPPLYKTFTHSIITGEFRKGQFRILAYRLNKDDFLLLSVFKKKTNETPKSEIERAEKRLREYFLQAKPKRKG